MSQIEPELSPPLDDDIRSWIIEMFRALGLGEPTFEGTEAPPPEPPSSEDTPLGDRSAALLLRVDTIALPKRMPTEETLKVEGQIASIRTVLTNAKSGSSLDKVETAIAKLETIVGGLNAKMEDRLARAAAMAKRLSALAVENAAYLTPSELPNIDERRIRIASDLSGPLGDNGLAGADTSISALEQEATTASGVANDRAARCKAVQTAYASVTRPTGGEVNDYTTFDADVLAITTLDTLPVPGAALVAAETALPRLTSESKRLAEELTARSAVAQQVSGTVPVERPAGLNPEEDSELAGLEKVARSGVALPLSKKGTSDAVDALEKLASLVETIKLAIKARDDKRKDIKTALDEISLDAIPDEFGRGEFGTTVKEIETALPLALTDDALDALEKRVQTLAKATEEARGKRAAVFMKDVEKLIVPDTLPPLDAAPLTTMIADMTKAAQAPIDASALDDAAKTLADFPTSLTSALEKVARRETDIAACVTAVATFTDPPGANVSETATLKPLREAVAFTPATPLTDDAVKAAQSALQVLKTRHEEVTLVVTTREAKRAEFVKKLLKLAPPMAATGAETIEILKGIGQQRALVDAATTISDIEATQAAITVLTTRVSDIEKLAAARGSAAKALSEAQVAIKTYSSKIDQGAYQRALDLLKTSTSLFDAASSVKNYSDAEIEIKKIQGLLTDAEVFYQYMITWRYEADLYLAVLPRKQNLPKSPKPTDAQKAAEEKKDKIYEAMEQLRDTCLVAAETDAKAGDFVNAKKKLDAFKTTKPTYEDPTEADPGKKIKTTEVDSTLARRAADFVLKIKAFEADKLPILKKVAKLGMPQPNTSFQAQYNEVRALAFGGETFDPAQETKANTDLKSLADALDDYAPLIPKFLQYAPLRETHPDVKTAMDLFKTDCNNSNFLGALAKLTALDTAPGNLANLGLYTARRNKLTRKVVGTLAALTGPAEASLNTPWTKAETETNHANKMAELDAVEAVLPDLMKMIEERDPAVEMRDALDKGKTFQILKTAEDHEAAANASAAAAAYKSARETALVRLANYQTASAMLQAVLPCLPASATDLSEMVNEALRKAEEKARALAWDDADKLLNDAMDSPEIAARAIEIATFNARKKAILKHQPRVLSKMQHDAAKKKLTDPWDAALDLGETQHNYIAAIEALDTHITTLTDARRYVAAAVRARSAVAGMKRIEPVLVANKAKLDANVVAATTARDVAKQTSDDRTADASGAKAAKTRADQAVKQTKKNKDKDQPSKALYDQAEKAASAANKADQAAKKDAKRAKSAHDKAVRALRDAEDARTEAQNQINNMYGGGASKGQLDTDLAAAELEAAKGDFAAAVPLFNAICTAAAAGMKVAMEAVQAIEDGHYVDAHGPQVTRDQQVKRLLDGTRPGGTKKVKTLVASNFTDISDLLATRDRAIEAAKAKDARVAGTEVAAGEALEIVVETVCEAPVGDSLVSDCPKQEMKGGVLVTGDTADNYRDMLGLTRVITKIIFLFDDPDKSRSKPRRLTSFENIDKAYQGLSELPPPKQSPAAKYSGKWVVHQHYPNPTGFDPDLGDYID